MDSVPIDWRSSYQQLADAIDVASEGFALFDADDRYVTWSRRYAEIYGPIVESIVVGARYEDVVRDALAKKLIVEAVGREEEWLADRLAEHRRESHTHEHLLHDGRWIRVEDRRTADGGRVSVRTDITERKWNEVKNREQKQQLDAAVNNMVQGLVMFDADGKVALWNQRYIDLYGLSTNVVREGCTFLELMKHREALGTISGDVEENYQRVLKSLEKGETWRFNHALSDGRVIQAVNRPLAEGGWVSTHEDITERQRTQARLDEQKLQLDTAVDNMAQGLLMFDADLRMVLWNQRYIDMYGLSSSVVREGCTFLELMKHREELGTISGDAESNVQRVRVRLAEGKPWSFIHGLSDGRSVQTVNRPLADGGWVSTHDDITERQQAEAKIREQKLQLDAAVGNITQGLVMFDADQRLVLWNQHYVDMYGMSPDIVKAGCNHLDLLEHRKELGIIPDDPKARHQYQLASLEKGKPWRYVLDLPDGRFIRVINRPMADGGWVSTHEDITERQQAESKIREQKLQLDTAVDNIVQGLVMFDADECLILWNQRYVEMYGLSHDIVRVGCSSLELMKHRKDLGVFVEEPEEHRQRRSAHLAEKKPWSFVFELPDGRSIQVVHRLVTGGGWVSTHEDISERKHAEVKISEQKLQLDTAVDNMAQGLLMFDASDRLALWNQRYIDMYGVSPSVLREGCTHLELLEHRKELGTIAGDPEERRQGHLARLAEGKPWRSVNDLPDGRSIQAVNRAHAEGGWVSTHEDITERRQNEAERQLADAKIREQKLQLDTAVDNLVQGLVMFGADERVILVNQRMIEMYGFSPSIIKEGCTHLEMLEHRKELGVFTGDPQEQRRLRLAQLAEGVPWISVRALPDGRNIQIAHRPLAGGGWLSTHEDITERQQAEAKIREQKLQLDAAVDNMAQGLVMFDANERVVLVNQRYIEIYRLSPDTVKAGRTHLELVKHRKELGTFAGDPEAHRHQLLAQLAEGKPWDRIVKLPDGRSIQIVHRPLANGGRISTHEDVTERQQAHNQIEYLAHHDALTRLPNRTSFNTFLSNAIQTATRQGTKIGVLWIDIDRFKEVNDVFGHAAGDLLLRKLAERLNRVAEGAFVGRLGGNEFCILATKGHQPTATEKLARGLQAAMTEEIDLDGHVVLTSMSIGAVIYPNDGADATTLLANADAALYRAKSEGRGSICFFDDAMDKELRERRLLQHELRFAIGDNQLRLIYQPQARTTGKIIGFEALVRWQHPERGLIDADIFVPSAEGSGLVIQLGDWVLREACREAATWNQELQIAVNLSPAQFKHGDLSVLVRSVLQETGLSPDRLELEITEGVLIGDFPQAVSILLELKALGVKIVLDDFGTGYSSLSYLHAFPFDKIKIDKNFVAQLDDNPRALTIIRTIIGLAHGLSIPAVAEGVETEEQLAFLEQEGCDEIQGYFTGRPKRIDDYAEIVGRGVRLA